MKEIKSIMIDFENLTEDEQIRLFLWLGRFAGKELPIDKDLIIGIRAVEK